MADGPVAQRRAWEPSAALPGAVVRTSRHGDARARLAYGLRLLPAPLLIPMWGLWCAALILYCTAPAWSGHVPDALSTYRLLERWPGVLAGCTAAVCAAVDAEGDPPGLLHALPAAGLRLWLDRLALAGAGWALADATALAAARSYLPLPWGPALGTTAAPSAMEAALGFLAGGLWGSWAGGGAVYAVWVAAALREMLGAPLWRFDPFLATQAPAGARLLANRWTLAAAAAGLAALSTLARRHPDRWGAWLRLPRPRLPGGWRASAAGVLAAGALAAAAVWLGVRPALLREPARALLASGAVRVAGTATLAVHVDGGRWYAAVDVPVALPPLSTGLAVAAPAASAVLQARLGETPLLPVPGDGGDRWRFAGRILGWLGGHPAVVRLDLALPPPRADDPPGSWPGLQVGGADLGRVDVLWPAGTPVRPAGAGACGPALCWTGPATRLRLVAAPVP